eukprot:scaffold25014_cov186-Cylindrotheca_fusiformis.AAC.1
MISISIVTIGSRGAIDQVPSPGGALWDQVDDRECGDRRGKHGRGSVRSPCCLPCLDCDFLPIGGGEFREQRNLKVNSDGVEYPELSFGHSGKVSHHFHQVLISLAAGGWNRWGRCWSEDDSSSDVLEESTDRSEPSEGQ